MRELGTNCIRFLCATLVAHAAWAANSGLAGYASSSALMTASMGDIPNVATADADNMSVANAPRNDDVWHSSLINGPNRQPCDVGWLPGQGRPELNGGVSAAVSWDPDGAGPLDPVVVVAGSFQLAGGELVNNVAIWDGARFHPIGPPGSPGVTSTSGTPSVNALAVLNGKLIVAGQFTHAGGTPANNIAQWNGSAWSPMGAGLGDSSVSVRALAAQGDVLIAGGTFTYSGSRGVACWNDATQTWAALTTGVSGSPAEVYAVTFDNNGDTVIGGQFTTAGGVTAHNVARWNGSQWFALGAGASNGTSGKVNALALYAGSVYAGGQFIQAGGVSTKNVARWDGSVWSALGAPGGGADSDVLSLGSWSGSLVVGGYFLKISYLDPNIQVNRVARWDGTQWYRVGSGIGDGGVSAVCENGGALYAGGSFTSASPDIVARYLARWNGAAWRPTSEGFQYDPNAIPVPSTIDPVAAFTQLGGELYAGGRFFAVEGVALQNLAHWNGADWQRVGNDSFSSGPNGAILTLGTYNASLIIGGAFTLAGGVDCKRIARWNGTNWSALGPGLSSTVRCQTVLGGSLYVGGDFTSTAGGAVTLNGIGRWDSNSWSPVGAGFTGLGLASVHALATHNNHVYAGGDFSASGATVLNDLGRWDPNSATWLSVGGGANGVVHALLSYQGYLIAGGDFTSPASHIARWDETTSTWTPLGAGFDGSVRALAVYNGDLIAAGEFTHSGAVSLNRIARWDGAAWQPFAEGADDRVAALAIFGDTLVAGGRFISAGGNTSTFFAQWAPVGDAPYITDQPLPQIAPAGGEVPLEVGFVSGAGGTVQWYKGATPMEDGPRVAGAHTGSMLISPALPVDAGLYHAHVTDACGAIDSDAVQVAITIIDCNGNGIPDFCDISCGFPCNEIPGCGQFADCDGDFIPDICEVAQSPVAVEWATTTGLWNVSPNWCPAIVPDNTPQTEFDATVAGVNARADLDISPTVRRLDINTGAQVDVRAATGDQALTVVDALTLADGSIAAFDGRTLTIHADVAADATSVFRAAGAGSTLHIPADSTIQGGFLVAENGALIDLDGSHCTGVSVSASGGGDVRLRNGGWLVDATIQHLEIPSGATGSLGGTTTNVGMILVNGTSGLATLQPTANDDTLRFAGVGTLALNETTGSPLAHAQLGAFRADLHNGPGHTIAGTGRVQARTVTNEGTLRATALGPRAFQILADDVLSSGPIVLDPNAALVSVGDVAVSGGLVTLGDHSSLDVYGQLALADGAQFALADGAADSTFVADALRLAPSALSRSAAQMLLGGSAQGAVLGDIDITGEGPPCLEADRGCTPPVLGMAGGAQLFGFGSLRLIAGGHIAMADGSELVIDGETSVQGGATLNVGGRASFTINDALRLGPGQPDRSQTIVELGGQAQGTIGGDIEVSGDGPPCLESDRGCTPPVLGIVGNAGLTGAGGLRLVAGGQITMAGGAHLAVAGAATIAGGATLRTDADSSAMVELGVTSLSNNGGAAEGGQLLVSGGSTVIVSSLDVSGGGCLESRGCTPPVLSILGSSRLVFPTGGGITLGGGPVLVVDTARQGDAIELGGDWDNRSTNPTRFQWRHGTLALSGTPPTFFEVAGVDLGPHPYGLLNNFAITDVRLATGADVTMRNVFSNGVLPPDPCREALYVRHLTIGAGATLRLDNVHLYYQTLENDGTIIPMGCGGAEIIPEFADMNENGHLDQLDIPSWAGCMLGPDVPLRGCGPADLDLDGDADLRDAAILQTVFGVEP